MARRRRNSWKWGTLRWREGSSGIPSSKGFPPEFCLACGKDERERRRESVSADQDPRKSIGAFAPVLLLPRAQRFEGGLELVAGELPVLGEFAGAGQPFAAVHRDAVAGLIGAEVREQERRQVGDLFFPAEAAERDLLEDRLFHLGRGHEPGEGPFVRDWTRRDRVD